MAAALLKATRKKVLESLIPDAEVDEYRTKANFLENKLKIMCIRRIVKIREAKSQQTIAQAVE